MHRKRHSLAATLTPWLLTLPAILHCGVALAQLPSAAAMRLRSAEWRVERSWNGEGHVLTGRIQLEEPTDEVPIVSYMEIRRDGHFVTALHSTRKLGFRAHGYDPLDITPPEGAETVVDLGDVVLKRTPPADTAQLSGRVLGLQPSERATVTLTVDSAPPIYEDSGNSGGANMSAVAEKKEVVGGESWSFSGLSPIRYIVRVHAPGYLPAGDRFTPGKGETYSLGDIELTPAPVFEFTHWSQFKDTDELATRSPKVKTILYPGSRYYVFAENREDRSRRGNVYLSAGGGQVIVDCSSNPRAFYDLGEQGDDIGTLPSLDSIRASFEPLNQVALRDGHTYLFEYPSRETRASEEEVRHLFRVKRLRPEQIGSADFAVPELPPQVLAEAVEEKNAHIDKRPDGLGCVIVGQVRLEDPTDAAMIRSQARLFDDGHFAAAMYPGGSVGFRAHGYNPLNITPSLYGHDPFRTTRENAIVRIGDIRLTRTATFETSQLTGRVMGLREGELATVSLFVGASRYVPNADDREPLMSYRAAIERREVSEGETWSFAGLSPTMYSVEVHAPTYRHAWRSYMIDHRTTRSVGDIHLTPVRRYEVTYWSQFSDLSELPAQPKETATIICDKGHPFRFTDEGPESESTMYLYFLSADGELRPHWSLNPSSFYDLGEQDLDHVATTLDRESIRASHEELRRITLQDGHTYYFENPRKNASCLFRVKETQAE